MRILVDSSVWIDFLNGHASSEEKRLVALLGGDDDLCTCGLVVTEVLQGLRRDGSYPEAVALFSDLTFLETAGIAPYLKAAELFRRLRDRGVAIRSAADCIIATIAEAHGCWLLARDRDLEVIAESGLVQTGLLS